MTLRDSTEWVELVDSGWNFIVGADKNRILEILEKMPIYGRKELLYGDGKTAEKILDVFLNIFS
ncbi:MAG: UDP-N-acetylglucosamine 2-epimerase [Spirochaetes bacterium]|nr:UDP-N-acetylglucosamine 2-epimerase [Spirochaetota bacterium]